MPPETRQQQIARQRARIIELEIEVENDEEIERQDVIIASQLKRIKALELHLLRGGP